MGSIFRSPSPAPAPAPAPVAPPPEPKPEVTPNTAVSAPGATPREPTRARRRVGAGAGGASLSGTVLTGGQGVTSTVEPTRKTLLGQ